jgi:hypothetical protein
VREACGGDAELQREVLSLLANHEPASDSKPWAAAAAAKLIDRPTSLEPGQCPGAPRPMVAAQLIDRRDHGAKSVVTTDQIIGCPHEGGCWRVCRFSPAEPSPGLTTDDRSTTW